MVSTSARISTALALFLTVSLSGCSKIRLAYDHLDWMLTRTADRYLDLGSSQEERFKSRVETILTWHRREMVPRYAKFLRLNAEAHQKGPVTREWLDARVKEAESLIHATMKPFLPAVAAQMAGMTPAQIAHLEKRLNESNERMQENVGRNPDDRVDRMTKNIARFFDRWLVELSSNQKKMIREHLKTRLGSPDAWWTERLARQKRLSAILRSDSPDKEKELLAFLELVALRPESEGSKEYREQYAYFRKSMSELLFEIFKSMDLIQRRELHSKLSHYAWEFEEIEKAKK